MRRPTPPDVRARGQHFLTEAPSVVRRMVEAAAVQPGEQALDVGAGRGEFTRLLSDAVGPDGHVTSVELEAGLARRLQDRGVPRVTVVTGDVLQVALPSRIDAVVSNPPYRILPPLLRRLLEHGFGRAVMVMPRELVERLRAVPGSEAYGKLTVQIAVRARTELLFTVPRRAFDPPPAVASSVAKVVPNALQPSAATLAVLDHMLEVVWDQRKRTNRHAFAPLATSLQIATSAVTDALRAAAIQGKTPLETTPEEFVQVAAALAVHVPAS